MVILFFKAVREADTDHEPAADKIRRILESHVEEAKTGEERDRAEKDLAKFRSSSPKPQ